MAAQEFAVGIDLGTVNSVVAIYRDGKLEIIKNDDDNITPSYVYFSPETGEAFVGVEANNASLRCPENAVYDVKRIIGRSFDDEFVQQFQQNCEYKILTDNVDNIKIKIKHGAKHVYKNPSEISAEVLKKLKALASKHVGVEINDAVITVPAYFNFAQRTATKKAAELAGLNVLMLLNEPTAASLNYLSERVEEDTLALIFDLGGGTLDISIVKMVGEEITTLAVDGDTFLGGRNFDETIFKYFSETKEMYPRLARRVKNKIESLKKNLSFRNNCVITLDEAGDEGEDIQFKLSKKEFENLNMESFEKCIHILDRCLNNAEIAKTNIQKIILVGGSSKIPKLREMLIDYFDGQELMSDINPEEAVAAGAAIQAAFLKGHGNKKFHIVDVIPFSLGIVEYGDRFCKIFHKFQTIPAEDFRSYKTISNNQKSVTINVYEGERLRCKLNQKLGTFVVQNLPLGVAGSIIVRVTFSIDKNGILKVKAEEMKTGASSNLDIQVELCNYRSNIYSLIKDEKEDTLFQSFVNLKVSIREICVNFQNNENTNRADLEKCEKFIYTIDDMQYEQKHTLLDKVNEFINEVESQELAEQLGKILKIKNAIS